MKATLQYTDLTAQLDGAAILAPISGLPANSATARMLFRAFEKATGREPYPETITVYCGYLLREEIWFIDPDYCPPLLSTITRRHISRVLHGKAVNHFRETGYTARQLVQSAIGFRRARFQPQQLPMPTIARARQVDLAPQEHGIYKYSRALGIEIEGTSPLEHGSLSDYLPYYTRVVSDSSIRTLISSHIPAEVKMLLDRATFDQRLHKVCKTLQAVGFVTNKSCGLHVHIDARHLDMATRKKIQRTMTKWLVLLVELVPLSRRDNNYCRLDLKSGRYCAVSVQTGGKNTIEVRLHSATTDQTKITMWLRLLELLAVLPPPAPKLTTTLAGLESLPLCEWDKNYWRARHRVLNPASYPDPGADTTENE